MSQPVIVSVNVDCMHCTACIQLLHAAVCQLVSRMRFLLQLYIGYAGGRVKLPVKHSIMEGITVYSFKKLGRKKSLRKNTLHGKDYRV